MVDNKKILIVVNNLNIGGTISSLYNLLFAIDTNRISVDVFSRNIDGSFEWKLPNCRLLPENIWLSHTIHPKGLITKLVSRFLLCVRKFFQLFGIDLFNIYNLIGGIQCHTNEYDAVIGFDESLAKYIRSLPAQKRIIWIHCDYRRYANGKNESKYYNSIDKIVCVSNYAKDIFCDYYPMFTNKTIAIHNVINVSNLYDKSRIPNDDSRFKNDFFTIISCGRFDSVKQFHLIPSIVSEIKNITHRPFCWYIIGGGNTIIAKHIQDEIEQYGVSDYVKLLGLASNPYNYMVGSDLYVCTSFSESYPMVVNEAKALGIPIVCNAFPSASESVKHEVDGYIIEIKEMPRVIASMIEKPKKFSISSPDNNLILDQFYSLF